MDESILMHFGKEIQANSDGSQTNYALPNFLSKQIGTYASMKHDLALCIEATAVLLEYKELAEIFKISLWHTIIILYGRFYTNSTDAKLPKLEAEKIFATRPELLSLHEYLMNIRHNFVAHRGSTYNEFVFPYLILKHDPLEQHVSVKVRKRKSPEQDELVDYMVLFSYMQDVIQAKFQKASNGAWNTMLKNLTPKQISLLDIGKINFDEPID